MKRRFLLAVLGVVAAVLASTLGTSRICFAADFPKLAYLTDVEGKWRKFEDFLLNNPAVYRDASGVLQVKDGAVFVYGGDATGEGPNNLRVVNVLNDLKKRFQNRVVIIAGNRDLMRMQIPEWMRSPEIGLELMALGQADTPENRIRYILSQITEPIDFENRRQELELSYGREFSNGDVVQNYIEDLAPGGPNRTLLESAQLIYRNGNTLVVHGAVLEESFGFVPDRPDRTFLNVDEWASELNRWYRGQLAEYASQGSAPQLMRYYKPIPGTWANRASVVMGRYTDKTGNSQLPSKRLVAWLKKNGIARIVVGHTPQGHGPTVLREGDFEIILGDNTNAPHGSKILVEQDSVEIQTRVELQGTAPDYTQDYTMKWTLGDPGPMGQRLKSNGHLVKAQLKDGNWLTFNVSPPPGFEVTHGVLSDNEVHVIGVLPARASCSGNFGI